jgi:uncharacterized protein
VKVKVLEVDVPRKRISLTMRLNDDLPSSGGSDRPASNKGQRNNNRAPQQRREEPVVNNAMAAAFAKLRK